jgi:hypothetical protein
MSESREIGGRSTDKAIALVGWTGEAGSSVLSCLSSSVYNLCNIRMHISAPKKEYEGGRALGSDNVLDTYNTILVHDHISHKKLGAPTCLTARILFARL